MKKRLFAFALILCLLLTGCGTGPADPTEDPGATQESTTPMPDPVDFKINGVDLENYTIVWAESEYVQAQQTYSDFLPEKDMNQETAERLQQFFRNTCGVELDVISNSNKNEYEYEIYVGAVDRNNVYRSLSLGRQKEDDYRIAVQGNYMIICGGAYGTTWHAMDYFEANITEQLSQNDKVSFEDGYNYAGEYHMIKIGMVGDSITQGSGSSTKDRGVLAHPNQIGRILWKDCLVYNYGQAGRTMRDDHEHSYMSCSTYQEALIGARQMDIMTVMLGTNDADRFYAQGWTDKDEAKFVESCEKLIKSFSDLNSELKFFLFNAPTCFRMGSDYLAGIPDVREAQQAAYDSLVNKGYNMLGFLDVGKLTEDMGLYFADGLHPIDAGHKLLAERIAEYFKTELLSK